jgi:hypothetical protein
MSKLFEVFVDKSIINRKFNCIGWVITDDIYDTNLVSGLLDLSTESYIREGGAGDGPKIRGWPDYCIFKCDGKYNIKYLESGTTDELKDFVKDIKNKSKTKNQFLKTWDFSIGE